MEIKTIDIQAKEWLDKANGNSYFSAIVTLNFGLENQKSINIPFGYGYGSFYEDKALQVLQDENYLPNEQIGSFSRFCRENNIELRCSKKENCLKSEVKNFTNY